MPHSATSPAPEGPHESLPAQVSRLVAERDQLADLSGEMLATLLDPANHPAIARLGPMWADLIHRWRGQYTASLLASGRLPSWDRLGDLVEPEASPTSSPNAAAAVRKKPILIPVVCPAPVIVPYG